MAGPLDGLKIIDMTTVIMGPYMTQILADLGADVIKVESPGGDTTRQVPPMRNQGMGAFYLQNNRNKRSIVIDMKKPDGLATLLALLADADAFVSNVRPAALARLGLTDAVMAKANPGLVTMALVGFGQNGPYAADPAYDDLIQGLTAVPSMLVTAGSAHPHYVPLAFNDRAVGLHSGISLLAAIRHRDRTGEGQHIEVPMFETMVEFVMGDHMAGLTFNPPQGPPGYTRSLNADRRPYKTSDGHVCNIIYTDKHWRAFAKIIGRPDLLESDDRFANLGTRTVHAAFVYDFIGQFMPGKTTAEWIAILKDADIPVTPLHTLESIMDDPHLQATRYFQPFDHPSEGTLVQTGLPSRWSKTRRDGQRPAPRLGEQSAEILRQAGVAEAEIVRLCDNGTIVQAS
ncbi:MAG: hypothetical protein RL367_2746 [Pseudomonadota bacterium]